MYYVSKQIDLPFIQVVEKTISACQQAGFGLLSQIDVSQKFKDKLNIDFGQYVILGICEPALALAALQAEINFGLFLPCNVIVYQIIGQTTVTVAVIKPQEAFVIVANPQLAPLFEQAEKNLNRVIDLLDS